MNRAELSLKTLISLKRLSNDLDKCTKQELSDYCINVNEFAVLEALFHKGAQTVQQIKQRILIANSSTTYIIDQLCTKKLVERQRDAQDKRVIYVNLTEEGKHLIQKAFPLHKKQITEFFYNLSEEELKELHTLLKKATGYIS